MGYNVDLENLDDLFTEEVEKEVEERLEERLQKDEVPIEIDEGDCESCKI